MQDPEREAALDEVRAGALEQRQLVLALDGKSLRGAVQDDGRCVHLFAAMVHDAAVVAQREVDHKTYEITAVRPLLEDVDLCGAVVTADAMHAQRDHARFMGCPFREVASVLPPSANMSCEAPCLSTRCLRRARMQVRCGTRAGACGKGE